MFVVKIMFKIFVGGLYLGATMYLIIESANKKM